MDDERLEMFFQQLSLIDQRGVARLGVRCYVAAEPGECPTIEERPRRANGSHWAPVRPAIARKPVGLRKVPELPSLPDARTRAKRGKAARLLARLARAMRSVPASRAEPLPSMAVAIEWPGAGAALKKS